ncbi:MAG: hypothetical protein B6D56_00075 [Candidatus Omnitrophica bacterium 4484_70.1]|nr:MAG: hypothetical protein B6D56_00075 [Candidatus Omnitrophica bacterium 4484_70.1]
MEPFHFHTRLTQIELLGKTAKNIKELYEGIKAVPSSSIYYHTHHYLEQHRYFSPEHPNDFSYWITTSLGLKKLGEEIASVDIFRFSDIEELRKEFLRILEICLKNTSVVRDCLPREEFRFLSSRIFILPTPYKAANLREFLNCLEKVTIHSLYFHIFEARLRLKKHDNDFSCWLRDLGYKELADRISKLDPYTYTLEGLRKRIINLVKNYL